MFSWKNLVSVFYESGFTLIWFELIDMNCGCIHKSSNLSRRTLLWKKCTIYWLRAAWSKSIKISNHENQWPDYFHKERIFSWKLNITTRNGFFFTINKSLRFYSNIVFSRKNSFGILWNSKNRLKLIWSPLKIIFFQFVVIFLMVIRKRLRLDKLKNILEKNST